MRRPSGLAIFSPIKTHRRGSRKYGQLETIVLTVGQRPSIVSARVDSCRLTYRGAGPATLKGCDPVNWKEIISAEDCEQFLEAVQDLHDSCIVQAVYTPDTYVEESGAMQPINTHSQLVITLQQQILGGGRNTIHLHFEGIVLFRLFPRPPRYDSIIYDCTLLRRDGLFYWADFHTSRIDASFGSIDLSDPGKDAGTWVVAKKMFWKMEQTRRKQSSDE